MESNVLANIYPQLATKYTALHEFNLHVVNVLKKYKFSSDRKHYSIDEKYS